MYGIHPPQWVAAFAPGGHHAGTPGQRSLAQSDEAAATGSFSPPPHPPTGWLGFPGEPPRTSGSGAVSNSGGGVPEAFPQPTSSSSGRRVDRQMKFIALGLVRFYQACLSPLLPSSCRFYPSCSAYAQEAVEKWGTGKGIRLTLGRLLRCRPYGGHGYDPVP